MKKRALFSVSDKSGITELATELVELGYEILSTGGTKKALEELSIPVTGVEVMTGFPEILEGRVKTLHPFIHGGLLAKTDDPNHLKQLEEQGISPIDLVCVNLYPFQQTIARPNMSEEEAIENIDIGGPTMLRAAAKNHEYVTVIVDAVDYDRVLAELKTNQSVSKQTKRELAAKVFRHTAAYDAMISQYMTEIVGEEHPERLTLTYERKQSLRYGENPHQNATFFEEALGSLTSLAKAKKKHGKELSYNNIRDADAALQMVQEFSEPAAIAVKHMNPCGIGVGKTLYDAFLKAYESDPVSIFGGVIALNRAVEEDLAEKLSEIFLEIIIAPAFTEQAMTILTKKKNIRLLTISLDGGKAKLQTLNSVEGGLLVQDADRHTIEQADVRVVTKRQPTEEEWTALKLGWKVVKHVKSNAIVITNSERTLGIGAGQMNRVGAAKIALEQSGEQARGAAMASDAFFPMDDTVEAAAKAGIHSNHSTWWFN